MNGEYIRQMSIDALYEAAKPFLKEAAIAQGVNEEKLKNIIALEQEKYKTLKEIPGLISFFFTDKVEYEEDVIEKVLKSNDAKAALKLIETAYSALDNWTETALEEIARKTAKENGLKAGQVFHPLRAAVSGRSHGPTLFKMLEFMGKDMVLKRVGDAINYSVS